MVVDVVILCGLPCQEIRATNSSKTVTVIIPLMKLDFSSGDIEKSIEKQKKIFIILVKFVLAYLRFTIFVYVRYSKLTLIFSVVIKLIKTIFLICLIVLHNLE